MSPDKSPFVRREPEDTVQEASISQREMAATVRTKAKGAPRDCIMPTHMCAPSGLRLPYSSMAKLSYQDPGPNTRPINTYAAGKASAVKGESGL